MRRRKLAPAKVLADNVTRPFLNMALTPVPEFGQAAPCPFCGPNPHGLGDRIVIEHRERDDGTREYWVSCYRCHCWGPTAIHAAQGAVDLWNHRAVRSIEFTGIPTTTETRPEDATLQ